jgi:hypothetical protein
MLASLMSVHADPFSLPTLSPPPEPDRQSQRAGPKVNKICVMAF